MKTIIKRLPFVLIIALNVFAEVLHYELKSIWVVALVAGSLLLVNMLAAMMLKIKDYFIYGISVVGITGIAFLLIGGPIGELYIRHINHNP